MLAAALFVFALVVFGFLSAIIIPAVVNVTLPYFNIYSNLVGCRYVCCLKITLVLDIFNYCRVNRDSNYERYELG